MKMTAYLQPGEYIDHDNPIVAQKALELTAGLVTEEEIVGKLFEFVRDSIKHSWDYKLNPVTCKASEALIHGTGYCYAKSHLLAALLRANQIPAGLCYQRLSVGAEGPPFCLHGLNAVFLRKHGWLRIDARGEKPGVSADFCPPVEKLAYQAINAGEADLPEIWAEPLSMVIEALSSHNTIEEVYLNLPDVQIVQSANVAMASFHGRGHTPHPAFGRPPPQGARVKTGV
jgi:hypothetical protein